MSQYKAMSEVTAKLAAVREATRVDAVRAIRRMETALQEALGAHRLHGLPNLNIANNVWRGGRIRAKHYGQKLPYPKRDDTETPAGWSKPTLCLSDHGVLVMVSRNDDGDVSDRRVRNDELFAQDAEKLAEVIAGVMEAHLAKAESRTATFARLREFAQKINQLLEEENDDAR